jgi:hypothetical protein
MSSDGSDDSDDAVAAGYMPLCGTDSDEHDEHAEPLPPPAQRPDHAERMLRSLEDDYQRCLGLSATVLHAPVGGSASGLPPSPVRPAAPACDISQPPPNTQIAHELPLPCVDLDGHHTLPAHAAATLGTVVGMGVAPWASEGTAPAEDVQNAMVGISLPMSAWPAWAGQLSADELVARLRRLQ